MSTQGCPCSASSQPAPFHHAIAQARDARAALRQVRALCRETFSYSNCLRKCPYSLRRELLTVALQPSLMLCASAERPGKALFDYISCERDVMERAQASCGKLDLTNATDFSRICRKLDSYHRCYHSGTIRCSGDATKLRKRLEDVLLNTVDAQFRIAGRQVPRSCMRWRERRLREFDLRHIEMEEEETMEPSTTFLPDITTSTPMYTNRGLSSTEDPETGSAEFLSLTNNVFQVISVMIVLILAI